MTPRSELDRLASSVLCVGFAGSVADEAPLEELARIAPGGIILFTRNTSSVQSARTLVESVRAAVSERAGVIPFVAIDQEGGRVSRLRRGAHEVPPMMALGATGDAQLAERVGALLASDVRSAGGDVNFAPVLDLAANADGMAIGDRAFGDDAELVATLGAAMVRGIQSQGVAATLKHFPGHGVTADDSHQRLPAVDVAALELRSRHLLPFARGVEAGAAAVMSAHVVYRALDDACPATLSPRILGALLRGELGFDGVCFTDCMEMEAIAQGVGTETGAVRALAAGADCVTISHRLEVAERTRSAIVAAVRSGDLPLHRLEQASQRVGGLREKLKDTPQSVVDANAGREAARRAVTLVRELRPSRARLSGPVTVVSFEGDVSEGARDAHDGQPSLSLALRRREVRSELFRVPLEPSSDMIEQLAEVVSAQQGREFVFLSRRAHVYGAQRRALSALLSVAPEAILASLREPFDIALFPQALRVLCTYGDGEASIEALADVLTGRASAHGRLPVRLPATCPS